MMFAKGSMKIFLVMSFRFVCCLLFYTTTNTLPKSTTSHALARTLKHKRSNPFWRGGKCSTLLNYIWQTIWQVVMGHKRQHTAPLACNCRKPSLSIKQQDKILRESTGSGASCVCGRCVLERQTEMKVRDLFFSLRHLSNVQLRPNNLSKSCASLRACAKQKFVKSTWALWNSITFIKREQ